MSALNPLQMTRLADAFWSQVDRRGPDECWPWKAGTNGSGYGRFALFGKFYYAHRQAFIEANGAIDPGLIIRHRCDNPICCNPAHLQVGTMSDNTQDAVQRGKMHGRNCSRGAGHHRSKLTDAIVRDLRARFTVDRRGDVGKAAETAGISWSQARRILEGSAWTHL